MRVMVLHPHAKFEVFPFRRCGTFSVSALIGMVTFTFDLLTLKVVSESHVTWATSVPILVFLGLSVLDLGPMYATVRSTSGKSIA